MELTLRAVKTADVPRVRAAALNQLRHLVDDRDHLDVVGLLLTELLSNALRHSSRPVLASIHWSSESTLLEVCDDNTEAPVVVESSDEASAGRGMKLVSALAYRWGWECKDGGKRVWCEIRPQDARVPA